MLQIAINKFIQKRYTIITQECSMLLTQNCSIIITRKISMLINQNGFMIITQKCSMLVTQKCCKCKELDHYGSCKRDYVWNPSACSCECTKACKNDEYL